MISACHNSKLVFTFVSCSRSRVLRHVAIRSIALCLDDPSDPPVLEKGQMRFFEVTLLILHTRPIFHSVICAMVTSS